MANFAGALIGAAIDRRDGDSGIRGALVGAAVQSAVRIAMPIIATYAVGWAVLFTVRTASGALLSAAQGTAEDIAVL